MPGPDTLRITIECDGDDVTNADCIRTDGGSENHDRDTEREPVVNGETTTQSVTLPRAAAEKLVETYPTALNVSEALRMAAQDSLENE